MKTIIIIVLALALLGYIIASRQPHYTYSQAMVLCQQQGNSADYCNHVMSGDYQ